MKDLLAWLVSRSLLLGFLLPFAAFGQGICYTTESTFTVRTHTNMWRPYCGMAYDPVAEKIEVLGTTIWEFDLLPATLGNFVRDFSDTITFGPAGKIRAITMDSVKRISYVLFETGTKVCVCPRPLNPPSVNVIPDFRVPDSGPAGITFDERDDTLAILLRANGINSGQQIIRVPKGGGTILSRVPVDPALTITSTSEIALDPASGNYFISVGPAIFEVSPDGRATGRSFASPNGQDVKGMEFGEGGRFLVLEADGTVSLLRLQAVCLPYDLTGTWLACGVACSQSGTTQRCFLQGEFLVENLGTAGTPAADVNFYLSGDNAFDCKDKLLGPSAAIPPLGAGQTAIVPLKARVRDAAAATGKYIIARVDAAGAVAETDEANNRVVFGPVP